MRGAVCERWASLSDRAACGDPLSPSEREFLQRHPTRCSDCAVEARLWSSLAEALVVPARLFEPVPLKANRRSLPSRMFERALARRWHGLAAACILASLGFLWWKRKAAPLEEQPGIALAVHDMPRPSLVLISGEAEIQGRGAALAGASLAAGDVLRVREGRACLYWDGSVLCAGPSSELGFSGGQAADTNVEGHQVVSLRAGSLVAQVREQSPERGFVVETPRGTVTVKGTVFAVVAEPDGSVTVRVAEGAVLVTQADGARRLVRASRAVAWKETLRETAADAALLSGDLAWMQLAATLTSDGGCGLDIVSEPTGAEVSVDGRALGKAPLSVRMACGSKQVAVGGAGLVEQIQQVVLAEARTRHRVELEPESPAVSEPPSSTPSRAEGAGQSSGTLLALARQHRSAGRYGEAASVYRRVVAEYRGSAEAGTALVSLGELELSQLGAPAAALRSFERYLQRGGPLAPEAHYGRIRALRQLGRQDEARVATEQFVQKYPKSVQAAQLRAQLAAASGTATGTASGSKPATSPAGGE